MGKTNLLDNGNVAEIKIECILEKYLCGLSNCFSEYGRSCKQDGSYFVIEGDEYDTAFFDKKSKFFHYAPQHLIINNIELDHIDIFRDTQDILQTFHYLTRLVPPNGWILVNIDDKQCSRSNQNNTYQTDYFWIF